VPGVEPKTEAKLVAALARERPLPQRGLTLNRAWALAEAIAEPLGGVVAGDARRCRELCERFAVVCSSEQTTSVLDRFEALAPIVVVVERGPHRAVGVTVEGVPVELVVAPRARFGTELLRATGSDAYVSELEPLPDGSDEEAVYGALVVPFCPPELREEPFRGELPPLVRLESVRGDLHVHTTWSDGKASVLEMGEAARALGYEYLAICDHTRAVQVVPGLDADDVRRQGEEIAAANETLAPFRILRGAECDILHDGSLDPAGRRAGGARVGAGERPRGPAPEPRAADAADDRGGAAPGGEVHQPSAGPHPQPSASEPRRPRRAVRGVPRDGHGGGDERPPGPARPLGRPRPRGGCGRCRVVASTDAHSTRGLANMQLAVATARRGWATATDVLNTRPLDDLLEGRD